MVASFPEIRDATTLRRSVESAVNKRCGVLPRYVVRCTAPLIRIKNPPAQNL
jgi:hypothetical protein